jgi:hypothetical protein
VPSCRKLVSFPVSSEVKYLPRHNVLGLPARFDTEFFWLAGPNGLTVGGIPQLYELRSLKDIIAPGL